MEHSLHAAILRAVGACHVTGHSLKAHNSNNVKCGLHLDFMAPIVDTNCTAPRRGHKVVWLLSNNNTTHHTQIDMIKISPLGFFLLCLYFCMFLVICLFHICFPVLFLFLRFCSRFLSFSFCLPLSFFEFHFITSFLYFSFLFDICPISLCFFLCVSLNARHLVFVPLYRTSLSTCCSAAPRSEHLLTSASQQLGKLFGRMTAD